MCLHLFTNYFSKTVIWALQFDIETAFVISDGKVFLAFTSLESDLAAMLLVGAIHLQLFSFPVGLLHEHMSVVPTTTMRTGILSLKPFFQTFFAELLLTAVHQVRLAQYFHTDRTGQLLWHYFNKLKLVLKLFSSHS